MRLVYSTSQERKVSTRRKGFHSAFDGSRKEKMGKKASCNILISYDDMKTSGGGSTMTNDLWEHLLSSPIKVITYCTFPLTFSLSQRNLCSPNQLYPYVRTPLWLSPSFFMEVSNFMMHLSSLMQWPTSSKVVERYFATSKSRAIKSNSRHS